MSDKLCVQSLQDDLVSIFLDPEADAATRLENIASYAEHQLCTASSADLLFHVNDFEGAAICYQVPEQLVTTFALLAQVLMMQSC